MGKPAAVENDIIQGVCTSHKIPSPNGSPMTGPPMPFMAPINQDTSSTVRIETRAAAVVGSSGLNTPPHVGLHPSDTSFAPPKQKGEVKGGSGSVFIDGKKAAFSGCDASMCSNADAKVMGTASSVLIGD